MRLRRLFHVGTVVLLVFCIDEGAPTLMLTSMLMAVKSGLMVGKMSLGGLIMMLMAANQNQNQQAARQSSLLKQTPLPFDILSLMSGSHSNNVPVTVKSSQVPAKIYSVATTLSPTTTPIVKVSRRRVFKKKVSKVRRDLSEKTLSANDRNETIVEENEIKDSPTLVKTMKDETITANEIKDSPTLETIFDDSITNEIKKVLSLQKLENSASKVNGTVAAEEKEVQTRIFRQISNLDPLNCLPKVMCGINTAPPSKQSNILNDYAYLMKTIFSRDDDDDNDKKPVTKNDKKKKKNKRKGGNKKKNDDESDESFEEFVLNDDDFERLALKEEADIEDLVQHEMADEEPGFLPYILKDANQMTESSENSNQDYPADDLGHEGGNEYSHQQSSPGGFPYPSQHHSMGQHHAPRPNNSPGSLLSSFIPKISFGKNKGAKGDAFSSDPFFDGFKRSLDFKATEGTKTLNITKEQDQLLKEIKMRRDKRNVYVMGKKKQIEMTTDPGEKFQIAAEVGRLTKSARQCRALFDQCPFKYTEVLKMISNLRNAVQGQVQGQMENTADKVVNLLQNVPLPKATVAVQPVAAASNIINVSSGSGGEHGGITSISHQLPNGEKIEINLKVLGKSTTTSTTTTAATTTTTSAPPRTNTTNVTGKHPNDAEKIFDDEDETHNKPLGNPTAQDTKKNIDSLESLESLKATLMAIEKINNATMNRKKHGKPITYSGIFHEVTGIGPVAPERVPNESSENESGDSSESYEDDEEEEDLPAPPPNIIKQPQEPNRPYRLRQAPQDQKHPYRLQRPSSPSHDEHQNPFPPRKPQIRPQLRPQFHINKQQHRIRARTTTPTTTTTTPKTPSTTSTSKTTASANRNKLRPVASKSKGHKTSQKDEPVIVPYTEKETVVNPAKQKVSSQGNSNKKPDKKPSGAENNEDYDEGDIDGDDNDNNTSEEDEEDAEDELRSEESGYVEHRLNIPHRPPHPHPQFVQNDSDDNEDDEADSDRVVIKPSITGNTQQQMQRSPPPHPHPPNQSPHSPPQPPNPPQRPPQLRPNFHHRRLKVSKSRTKRSRFPSNRRTVKRKHPNHRYPCSAPVESTTPATDNIKNHSLEDRQPIASPSTMSPPSLPYKYPQYRSPHKM